MLRRVARFVRPISAAVPVRRASETVRPPLHKNDMMMSGANAHYLEALYEDFQHDSNSVAPEIAALFRNASSAPTSVPLFASYNRPPSRIPTDFDLPSQEGGPLPMKVSSLVRAFRKFGHLAANLDPLGLQPPRQVQTLTPEFWGLSEADLASPVPNFGSFAAAGYSKAGALSGITVGELYKLLQRTYCGPIGIEMSHITAPGERAWLIDQIELLQQPQLPAELRRFALQDTASACGFEQYCGKRFATHKRFGLDGTEALVPGLNAALEAASESGVDHFVFGMPHRGRLVTLTSILNKPLERIFSEFRGGLKTFDSSGDVKYHLGVSQTKTCRLTGRELHMSLMANPSHLEAVNPLVMGKTRAKMLHLGDTSGSRVMPIVMHGDAAFAGQGIVYECSTMAGLTGYTNYGTLQVVVNNQIGFTTNPAESRTVNYCTNVALSMGAPVIHVNGDDPDAVVRAFRLAVAYRQRFQKDVVIDLIGYRRFGHNELDEPKFTQPKMYNAIAKKRNVFDIYADKIVADGVMSREEVLAERAKVDNRLESAYQASADYTPKAKDWLESLWKGFKGFREGADVPTSIPRETYDTLVSTLTTLPEGFTLHPTLARIFAGRKEDLTTGKISWHLGELLAFGSLQLDGTIVRLSGQDCERGTFSQRHAVVHDQHTFEKFNALATLPSKFPEAAPFQVLNSPLSEFGVLGFELGFSLENPNMLVCWEAQFGDFANNAQVIFDQFLASGEAKWLRQSGLVVLLPHGFDGQGPEHSSARLERFLQLTDDVEDPSKRTEATLACAEQGTNMQVVYCTTAANHFHVLRRQLKRNYRKPLVCFVSKASLRRVTSTIEDLTEGSFQKVIGSSRPKDQDGAVKRHLLCSGQVYFALKQFRDQQNLGREVAITRIEQLSPFPWDEVKAELERYPDAEVVWVQEEPRNNGAWSFVSNRLRYITKAPISYVGRVETGAVATGYKEMHDAEVRRILHGAMGIAEDCATNSG